MTEFLKYFNLYIRTRFEGSSKYHLRTPETLVGPKFSLEAKLSLRGLPWIVPILLVPFVYDLQEISLPKRLPLNPPQRPQVL